MKNTQHPALKDFEVNPKVRLSALWGSLTLCYLYGDYFELYVPNKTEGLINGDNLLNSPGKLLLAAVLLAIPALMVCISIILKPRINRLLNISLGLIYTGIMMVTALYSLTEWMAFYVFLALIESFITIIIIYYAWEWPREQA